jgi:uncharacterized membrane protein YkoI
MNTSKLRSKKIVIPTIAAVAVIGVGGVVWSSASADELTGTELDRASSAALAEVGEGKVTDSEQDDDNGGYEVEVTKDDGTEVDVDLDDSYQVIGQDADDDRYDDANDATDDRDDRDDANDDLDGDDRVLTDAERTSVEKAALEAVGSGTVTDAEVSDDRGEAYEVEVRQANGTEWTVELDDSFTVLAKRVDN